MLFIYGTAPSKIVHVLSSSFTNLRTIYQIVQKDHSICTNFIEIRFNASESWRVCPTRRNKVTEISKPILPFSDASRPLPYLTLGSSCQFNSSVRKRNCSTESLERTWPSVEASEQKIKRRGRQSAHGHGWFLKILASFLVQATWPPALSRFTYARLLHRYILTYYYTVWSCIFGKNLTTYEV